jgi:hypothetical protein
VPSSTVLRTAGAALKYGLLRATFRVWVYRTGESPAPEVGSGSSVDRVTQGSYRGSTAADFDTATRDRHKEGRYGPAAIL